MIRLSLPTEPYWLDLPHGVRLFVRPLDTAIYEAARQRGVRLARQIIQEHLEIKAAGGQVTGLPDFTDEDGLTGLSQMLFVQALARSAIIKWEGVGDKDGNPVDPTDETVATLMRIHRMAEEFSLAYTATHQGLIAEGNASRPAPNGISAAGLNTAEPATKKGCPVPAADAAQTAKCAGDSPPSP